MTDLAQIIESGSAQVWLYVPTAIFLGALHGLEPGHSKTMMAAFIIAVRGTVWQAVLLGLSAAISHSLIIWLLAALALHYGDAWNVGESEPYFHLVSAAIIMGMAVWMLLRTRRELAEAEARAHAHGEHEPGAEEGASQAGKNAAVELAVPEGLAAPLRLRQRGAERAGLLLDTGHGWLRVALASGPEGAKLRIQACKATGEALPLPRGTTMSAMTTRLDGSEQRFLFEVKGEAWESTAVVPEPHEFALVLSMAHGDHAHSYRLRFQAPAAAPTGHEAGEAAAPAIVEEREAGDEVYQDAHERAHAEDIARRFANRSVTTWQIVLFGITGGLMPCPAAVTILVVCLHVKRVALGLAMVASFSLGLALTMVTVGALAAWSVHHAQRRFTGFGEWMRRAPYISCALLVLLAGFMAWQGWQGLVHGHAAGHGH